jgi:hypothetical protein
MRLVTRLKPCGGETPQKLYHLEKRTSSMVVENIERPAKERTDTNCFYIPWIFSTVNRSEGWIGGLGMETNWLVGGKGQNPFLEDW